MREGRSELAHAPLSKRQVEHGVARGMLLYFVLLALLATLSPFDFRGHPVHGFALLFLAAGALLHRAQVTLVRSYRAR